VRSATLARPDRLRRRSPLWIGAGLVLAAALVTAAAGDAAFDDAYITYAFARAVAAGDGLAWGGERVLGTSTPFLALLLGGLERLLPIGIPIWGALLTGAAAAAAALALAALGRREGWALGGAAAGLLWILWPSRFGHGGSEVSMAIAAVAAAALAFAAGRPVAAGIALALATLLRGEAGLAGPCLAAALVARDGWRRSLGPVARAAAVAAGLVGTWLLALAALAGTVVPRTLAAKLAQAGSALHIWDSAGLGLLREQAVVMARLAAGPAGVIFALAVAGVFLLARRRPPFALALAAWGCLHLLLIAVLGVPRYGWYVLPFDAAVVLGAGLGLEFAARLEGPAARAVQSTAALLVLVFAGAALIDLHGLAVSDGDPRRGSYRAVAELADRYPAGTTLASYEVGYLGYFGHRRVLDLLGLVTPETPLEAVRAGDLAAVRARLAPDLLMLPLNSGGLFESTIGGVPAFLSAFRLDRLQLEGVPHLAVYRRAGLDGRGEVELDLLPGLAADGARVELAGFPEESGLVAILAPGERRSVEVGAGPPLLFQAGLGAPGGDVAATLELEGAEGAGLVDGAAAVPEARWRGWRIKLPRRAASVRLTLACAAASDGPCWIGQPHLARPPRKRAGAG
jgi:arabinofuranosyltransferase